MLQAAASLFIVPTL